MVTQSAIDTEFVTKPFHAKLAISGQRRLIGRMIEGKNTKAGRKFAEPISSPCGEYWQF